MKQNNFINNDGNQPALQVGHLLHGTYCIEQHLSKGGFSNVYLATHIHLKTLCVIKEISPDWQIVKSDRYSETRNTALLPTEGNFGYRQFINEARCLQLINNRHVVRSYDLFEENGYYYLAMEYIEGENLKEKLEKQKYGKFDEKMVDFILKQLLGVLRDMHAHGIYHLDIKPANIILTSKGNIKLVDFGSCFHDPAVSGRTLPLSYIATYTDGFSPIEQIDMRQEQLGPWSDFYALGATLYNLLTGKLPPKTSDLIDAHINKNVFRDLDCVSPGMKALIQWLMQPNRHNRPQNARDILDFLNKNSILLNKDTNGMYEYWRVPLPANYILVSPTSKYRIIGTLTSSSDIDAITYLAQVIEDNADGKGEYYLLGERFEYRFSRRCGNGTVFDIDPMSTRRTPLLFYKNAEKRTGIKERTGIIIKSGMIQAERFNANGTSYYAVQIKLEL